MGSLILNRDEFVSLIENIVETNQDFDFEGFDEFDYYDALFILFKKWAETNIPEDERDYPISYLLEKYAAKFASEMTNGEFGKYEENFSFNNWNTPKVVQSMIRKGHHKLPTKRKNEKFTEKYKRGISHFIEELNLPPWAEMKIIEDKPYVIDVQLSLDFPEFVKDDTKKNISGQGVEREFEKFVQNFLGIDLGNPAYGQLSISRKNTEFKNLNNWVKNVLNKDIKKQIKNLESGRFIHSMRFETTTSGAELKIIFKGSPSWERRSKLKTEAQNLLNQLGYPRIKVFI